MEHETVSCYFAVFIRISYHWPAAFDEFPFAARSAKDRNEVAQIKYFFHDSFTARQIRVRDRLASHFEQVNFTPRRLLTDGSRIRSDFRDFSITSLQTAPRSPRFESASDLRDKKREERLNSIKSPEFRPSPGLPHARFVPLQSSRAIPLSPRHRALDSLPVLPLSHVYGREGRSLLKRVLRNLFPSSSCALDSQGDNDRLHKTTETIRYDSTAD